MARIAVVVLNWNGLAMTRECVRSLLAQTHRDVELHVVDNGSANQEAAALRAEFGAAIRLHALPQNLGFTGGCNAAFDVVLAEGACEFVALLNNDAVADPRWLEALLAAAAEPHVGIVASRMRLFAEPALLDNAGVWLLGNGEVVPRGRLQRAERWGDGGDLLAACGGAMLLRCAMLRAIGTFRGDFFANFEDVDLSLRAVATGWRIRYAPGAEVRHHLNATIRRVRDAAFNVRSVRNATWAWLVNLPWPVVLLNAPWFVLSNLAVVLLLPLAGRRAIAGAVVRGRWRALGELPAILAERRRLRPLRRAGWWGIWWRQRWFVGESCRLLWRTLRGRRGGVMAADARVVAGES